MKFSYSYYKIESDLEKAAKNTDYHDQIRQLFKYQDIELSANICSADIIKKIPDFIKELSLNGGNTIINIFRGWKGVEYLEIVKDVADKLDISESECEKCKNIEELDDLILLGALKKYFKGMSNEERQKKISDLGLDVYQNKLIIDAILGTGLGAGLYAMIAAAGQQAIANVIKQVILNFVARQAALNAGRFITAWVPFLNILLGGMLVLDIAGPAYRKTVPTILTLASIRLSLSVGDL